MTERDDDIIAALARGDEFAFEVFYNHYSPAIARFAWSLSPGLNEAGEIVQETFLTAWRKHSTIRLVDGSALPWLLTTCRNHARNHGRREKRWREAVALYDETSLAGADESCATSDLRWALNAIAALPDRDRQVCELCLLEGLTYQEAADRIGITESAAGKRLQRARAKLREEAAK